MSDPAKYRSKEEVEEVKEKRDPIDHFKTYMVKTLKVPENQIKTIEEKIKLIVAEAVEFSKTSPEPDPSELYTDVLKEEGATL